MNLPSEQFAALDSSANSQSPLGLGPRRALYIDNPVFTQDAFGTAHPLSIPRTQTVAELCRALDWLPDDVLITSTPASISTLERFHDKDYVAALRYADITGRCTTGDRARYNFGTMENPLFPGIFERAATTVGGSIRAAELALAGHLVFHPAGGTHHGQSGRASGFCYFNDPVFAILTLLDAGLERVVYADIDAHHGDGVEAAFESDDRVHTLSLHEAGRWPYSGQKNRNTRMCNLLLAKNCDDLAFESTMHAHALPFVAQADPEAVVITCGADALAGDPLSSMNLSNSVLWHAVEQLSAAAKVVVILGGGGYNPWTLARCWAGLWARLAGFDIPAVLPNSAQEILTRLECDLVDDEDLNRNWLTRIED